MLSDTFPAGIPDELVDSILAHERAAEAARSALRERPKYQRFPGTEQAFESEMRRWTLLAEGHERAAKAIREFALRLDASANDYNRGRAAGWAECREAAGKACESEADAERRFGKQKAAISAFTVAASRVRALVPPADVAAPPAPSPTAPAGESVEAPPFVWPPADEMTNPTAWALWFAREVVVDAQTFGLPSYLAPAALNARLRQILARVGPPPADVALLREVAERSYRRGWDACEMRYDVSDGIGQWDPAMVPGRLLGHDAIIRAARESLGRRA